MRDVKGLKHFRFSISRRSTRYYTRIDSLDDFISKTKGLFTCDCLKSIYKKLPHLDCTKSSWRSWTFLKTLVLVEDSVWVWLLLLTKAWQLKYKEIVVGFPATPNCQPGMDSVVLSILATAVCTGRLFTCFRSFEFFFVSNVTQFKKCPPFFPFCPPACCWYSSRKLQCSIKLNMVKKSLWIYWLVQRTVNSLVLFHGLSAI